MSNEGRIIDLTALEGAQSLKDYKELVLGEQVEEVLDKIKEAIESGQNIKNNSDVYLPNNVFIDGRRGSGKTTILLTVKALFEGKEKCPPADNKILEIAKKVRVVESLIDTSVNTSSITFYFLSWLKKEIEDKYYSNAELMDQLYETIKRFPGYLKTCDELCQDLDKNEEIEEALDKSDLNFRRELFKLIDLFLEKENKDAIIMFIDDIDISFPPKRIEKILTEIFMFLSHPKLLIISAGNYLNLIESLEYFVKETVNYKYNNKLKNISKSFLEKTFSKYKVKVPELSYEIISSFKIKIPQKDGKTTSKTIKEFLEQIYIIKILGWESPIFQLLFNYLSLREIVLILRESLRRIEEQEESKVKKVIFFCFSDIYQKVRNIDGISINFELRNQVALSDKTKPLEFEPIQKEIEQIVDNLIKLSESKEKTIDPIFIDFYKQSLLVHNLYLEDNPQKAALFWLWLNENFLFMDGFKKTLPRLIYTHFFRNLLPSYIDFDNKSDVLKLRLIKSSLRTWRTLSFNFQNTLIFFKQYDFYTGSHIQEPFRFGISKDTKSSKIFRVNLNLAKTQFIKNNLDTKKTSGKKSKVVESELIEKLSSNYLFLCKLLHNIEQNSIKLNNHWNMNTDKPLNPLAIDKLLGGFIDKIINTNAQQVKESFTEAIRVLYFLILYLNIALKIAYFYAGEIEKAFSNEILYHTLLRNFLKFNIQFLFKSLKDKDEPTIRKTLNSYLSNSESKLLCNLDILEQLLINEESEERDNDEIRNYTYHIKNILEKIKTYKKEIENNKGNLTHIEKELQSIIKQLRLLNIDAIRRNFIGFLGGIRKNFENYPEDIQNFINTITRNIDNILSYLGEHENENTGN